MSTTAQKPEIAEAVQILELGRDIGCSETDRISTYRKGDGIPFVILGANQRIQTCPELLQPAKLIAQTFDEVESFIEAANYYKDDRTRLYCVEKAGKFRAVIDDHMPDSRDQQVELRRQILDLDLTHTSEARAWLTNASKGMSQVEFAIFLEDHGWVVTQPSAAEFAEVALTLQAKKDVKFRSGIRLDNGDHKLLFEEDTRTAAGVKGQLDIPSDFAITLAIYHGGPLVTLEGKLRYRIADGGINFAYKFPKAETVLRQYVSAIRASIAEQTERYVSSVVDLG